MNHPEMAVPDRQLKPDREVTVQTRTLDRFNFDRVDLNKLDIQGAEYVALLGARSTILRNRPGLMVEEKPFSEEHVESIAKTADPLRSYGMRAEGKS